ncbi:MAG: hypothetical protein VKJ02_03050 [Snowella sp.]|nr:hypothetical protein [Snowella sp.]
MSDSLIGSFNPQQIVCMEHQQSYLYGEVVQIIESKKLCWMRPLLLAIFPATAQPIDSFSDAQELLDLRLSSDVAYPLTLFRPALDTEVIPLISQLSSLDEPKEVNLNSKQKLHQFLTRIWQDNQAYFLKTL